VAVRQPARDCAESDEQVYIPLQEKMLHRFMQQENVKQKLPREFSRLLWTRHAHARRQSEEGRLSREKFEVAYFRSMKFEILHATS